MSDRDNKAVQLKHSGCNCCQAVLLAFEDKLGMDTETLLTIGAGFGSGMGCMEATCGALVGAVMVDDIMNKRRNPSSARKLLAEFKESCGAVRCADLKGITTGRVLCSCDDCIRNAVRALEK